MKCTACGCTHLREVRDLVYADGNANINGDVYVCMECGHIDIFSYELLNRAKNEENKENEKKALIDKVNEEVDGCEKKISLLKKQIVSIVKELNILESNAIDENITVKQHNEILKEIETKKIEHFKLKNEIGKTEVVIEKLKYRLK